jgi:hypothetical protein
MTHWTKQHAGFYTLDGTDYAVASSWKQASARHEDRTGETEVSGSEWAVVRFTNDRQRDSQDGENMAWFDTMREARAAAERMAR